MELELKHLASYLPYGLKYKRESRGNLICELKTLGPWFKLSKCKPILHPFSDLTKEIEVNGKKFVPIVKLLKLSYPEHVDNNKDSRYIEITVESDGYPKAYFTYSAIREIIIRPFDIKNIPFWIVEKLSEWHFDVFGLIKEGLAIDINTL